MSSNPPISQYLAQVYDDWLASRESFSNVYLRRYWPIPFFGNPRTATVATVGVNPSSGEFTPERDWTTVRSEADYQIRLTNYFHHATPPHRWFSAWMHGLEQLGVSYKSGAAAHFDVSYRPTRAMLRNPRTNCHEFRRMVERDVVWLFRLLHLSPKLRGLLVFGPIISRNGSTERLASFVRKSAPRHGFRVLPDGGLLFRQSNQPERSFFLYEVQTSGHGTISEQVASDLAANRELLLPRNSSG